MSKVGTYERSTQQEVIQYFKIALKYDYLGNWEERDDNRNIEHALLKDFLRKQGYDEDLIHKAYNKVSRVAFAAGDSLYDSNRAVYDLLRYGVKVSPDVGEHHETVWLIDWKNPLNNHFAIAEEVSVTGKVYDKRPDIVIYINGIAVGILELKRGTVAMEEGIRQNLLNQGPDFIQTFFNTAQLVMAGNRTQGLRYGTIETPQKYYLEWKEASQENNKLLRQIGQICAKERIIELIRDFVVFDGGVKKLARHNQYFGTKAAQKFIKRHEGGIIWHTQGSGKSLTMVWLAKWIRENRENARVLLITDREELDSQIEKVFKGVNEDIYRTKSGRDLLDVLNTSKEWLIASLVHKFGSKTDDDYDEFTEEIRRSLTKEFRAKGNIFVFVDECHRTQSGKLHDAMKVILPDALFIGFTGTPLLKKDKKKSIEVFGRYIHTYKFDEAVRDGVVLDLRYEVRSIDQRMKSPKQIYEWFERKTAGLTDVAKRKLKQRWGTMQKILSSKDRLEQIVADILMDFERKERLSNGTGNAMLVAGSIYQACRYYDIFQQKGFTKCAIITSYEPMAHSIKDEATGEEGITEKLFQFGTYKNMLDGKPIEEFEREVKKKFIEEPARMKLLIVVDKLLTGFDAPPATYLYIDKKMRDHGLFQAICRVNRLDGESKKYGYIIDYKDLFKSLESSYYDYTQGAFEDYDREDIEGLLGNRLEKGKERLNEALDKVKALCEPVHPQTWENFKVFFCGSIDKPEELKETEEKRVKLYKYTVSLIRAYADIANEMAEAGYSESDRIRIKEDVRFFANLRDEVEKYSGDYIDLKRYEPAMRHLIDTYIRSDETEVLLDAEDQTLLELFVSDPEKLKKHLPESLKNEESMAEAMTHNLRKTIIEQRPANPMYFDRMSKILDQLIQDLRKENITKKEFFEQLREQARKIIEPAERKSDYPANINTAGKQALYDNLGQNEELTIAAEEAIGYSKQADFRGNILKERKIKNALKKALPEGTDIDLIFNIIKEQSEY